VVKVTGVPEEIKGDPMVWATVRVTIDPARLAADRVQSRVWAGAYERVRLTLAPEVSDSCTEETQLVIL
jgi:hypothetical protein